MVVRSMLFFRLSGPVFSYIDSNASETYCAQGVKMEAYMFIYTYIRRFESCLYSYLQLILILLTFFIIL
jgi:hypothetical protein